jgi:hypothetical protein
LRWLFKQGWRLVRQPAHWSCWTLVQLAAASTAANRTSPAGISASVKIGKFVTIEPNCTLRSCRVGDFAKVWRVAALAGATWRTQLLRQQNSGSSDTFEQCQSCAHSKLYAEVMTERSSMVLYLFCCNKRVLEVRFTAVSTHVARHSLFVGTRPTCSCMSCSFWHSLAE